MRNLLKFTVLAVFYVLMLPAGLLSMAAHRLAGTQVVFHFFSEGLSDWPGLPGKYARLCFYRQTLAEAHMSNEICFGAIFSKMETRLGRNARVGGRTGIGLCEIGEETIIGNFVSILSGRHQHNFADPDKPPLAGGESFTKVVIGSHTFVGEGTIVMADIGAHTIVGAGSVVVKPLPDNVVAAGNPAKVIRTRS